MQSCRGLIKIRRIITLLNSRNLPLAVALSEDSTRIVGRIQYDSVTNQLIGFVPPINVEGMPIPLSFPATNAETILCHFTSGNEVSNFLNVVMAQPLNQNAAPFCLLVYGTDNKYTTNDVIKRWKFIKKELKKINIDVYTMSTDADPRYSFAMRYLSQLGSIKDVLELIELLLFCIQDHIHIATKMRNFLLRTVLDRKVIPFGNRFIRLKHLIFLLVNYRKDQHQLTESILNPADRQNFSSVLRMCDEKVISMLKSKVDNGEATALFLEMLRDIIDSYMNANLSPRERLQKIWYPLFIIRIWRDNISKSKIYNLKDNFLTTYCYSCIELNANSLVQLMLYFKSNNIEELFLPHLFSSQQCESIFRQFRSLTSTYSTVTNCSVKEAISRISKIQLQNDVICSTSPNFIYPKFVKEREGTKIQQLPSKKEIDGIILECKQNALKTAIEFGLISFRSKSTQKATTCQLKPYIPKTKTRKKQKEYNGPVMSTKNINISNFKNIALKIFTEKRFEPITETCPYIEFQFGSKRVVVKKSSFCWLLRDEVHKMSNDRLLRVRTNVDSRNRRKRLQTKKITAVKNKKQINLHHKLKY